MTGNFCDGGISVAYDNCFASERVPADYLFNVGQRTPCAVTVRHFTSSAGSVDKFTAVLLPARSDIGQEYHKVVHGNSTQQLQLKQVQEISDHNGHSDANIIQDMVTVSS